MAIPERYDKRERPDWMPPFLWTLLTGGDDLASQAMGLSQPLGVPALGLVRAIPTAAGPVVEYTGRDLLPRLLATIGAKGAVAPIVEEIARTAVGRRGLARYGEATTPYLLHTIEMLRQLGVPGWRRTTSLTKLDPNLRWILKLPAGGLYSKNARGILLDYDATRRSVNLLHELLHAADAGAVRAGRYQHLPAARDLYDLYTQYGNPYYPTVSNPQEALAELGARYLFGQPFGTYRQWETVRPTAEDLILKALAPLARP